MIDNERMKINQIEETVGEITKGFFINCDYTLTSDALLFSIPFNSNGVEIKYGDEEND